ncbi:hypothetical protein D3C84_528970 [compost metagenome]
MQQFGLLQAFQAPGLGCLGRLADRDQPLTEQQGHLPVLVEVTVAEQHGAIERLVLEIHLVHIHPGAGELHLDIVIEVAKAAEA